MYLIFYEYVHENNSHVCKLAARVLVYCLVNRKYKNKNKLLKSEIKLKLQTKQNTQQIKQKKNNLLQMTS